MSSDRKTDGLNIHHDEHNDIVTICGIRYSGEIFRSFGFKEVGTWLRIEERHDGVLSVFHPAREVEHSFDLLTGKAK